MELALTSAQHQKLSITPQLRQSMEILHMSSLDLSEYIREHTADNPFIEINADPYKAKFGPSMKYRSLSPNEWWLNRNHKTESTLESALLEQVKYLNLDKVTFELCTLVIGSLDERGYLLQQKEWIVERLGVSIEQVNHAVQIIQSLEPYGLAASSLEECLLIQLDQLGDTDTLIRDLVRYDLMSIAKGKIQQLAKKYATDAADIQQRIDRISKLNPKPGSIFSNENPHYIIPDLVLKNTGHTIQLFIEEQSLPQLSLNTYYLDMMKQNDSKEVSGYLKKRWQAAKWVMQCIDQRKMTLLRVAGVIFERQSEFCRKGPSFIQSISMKQVADMLDIHESTVSRSVNNKYVMTPWGLYELKHFFTSSIKQSDGESVSAVQMKERIREIIRQENKSAPLSDQKIAEYLQKEGLTISRRTVTKYREDLNILSTAQRKKY
ncbi:RNA polymerase factor sigma-54 [Paenibacillus sp. tmac-D7]|uniref:RNA polymerase factor sigma-54 n=1 Tax=Paenibacillus sp. tmac-D7 TaxID=2591462 RepID=UPI001142E79E|nr:RNA polymerase factor sigma-54 [Paenibacillus sp. tmac-D7]